MTYLQQISDHLSALRREQEQLRRQDKTVQGKNISGQRAGIAFRAQQVQAEIDAAVAARESFKAALKEAVTTATKAKQEQYNARYGAVLEALFTWRDDCTSYAKDTRTPSAMRLFHAQTEARINNILNRVCSE